ncbi:MAG: membrane protein insertase YidC [Desulfuromonadaceae bacterium]|nr:membrane protein insertase YidC [Desulfuromonadaceae bacterium]
MENKNTLIAFGLILVIYAAYILIFPPPSNDSKVVEEKQPEVVSPVSAGESSVKTKSEEKISLLPAKTLPPRIDKESNNNKERKIFLENELFRAVLTNAGARIEKFELKKFKSEAGPDSGNIFLVNAELPHLGTLSSSGTGELAFSGDRFYQIAGGEDNYSVSGSNEATVVFQSVENQLLIEKIYRFRGNDYSFQMDLRVTNQGENVLSGSLETIMLQPFDESMKGNRFTFVGTATLFDDKLKTDSIEDLEKKPATYSGSVGWTGFEDKYFLKALVPLGGRKTEILLQMENSNVVNRVKEPQVQQLRPGETLQHEYLVYFGPRDLDILKNVGHRLEAVVDFGYFDIIARPLLSVLKFFYGFVGNYGWAIILLTVVIKILFWPLTDKSYGSMKAMQKIQPEMQKLRQKYKDDKQRLNVEIMQLYRTHKVNPLGGCLPMIIQIPVFFALYKVLMDDIALRHAPFMFWIQDLSAKDPYYITPIIMGVTMFIQQKLTPSTMDSTQAKILLYMPLVFTFMFLNFPSGLVIYWLVNNLLTILQQYLINRKPA